MTSRELKIDWTIAIVYAANFSERHMIDFLIEEANSIGEKIKWYKVRASVSKRGRTEIQFVEEEDTL
jgi:hypothetical protein